VVEQASESLDLETLVRIDIVETYGDRLPSLIDIIEQQTRRFDHPQVGYIFSTVHKFKGLEEDTVRLLGREKEGDVLMLMLRTQAEARSLNH
jgi:hypothetical protein